MSISAVSSREFYVGVDVGGSKVAVLVSDDQGREQGRYVAPTRLDSSRGTLEGIVDAIHTALRVAQADLEDVAAIGLGIPGRVEPEEGIVHLAVNLSWQNMPVGQILQEALGTPCWLENDVRAAALGLQRHPLYAQVQNLAYISIGTGISAGLILNGRLYRGAHGMAGEIGHMMMLRDGPRCQCGSRGCLEALASGPAIARRGEAILQTGVKTILSEWKPVTTRSVFQAAEAGDAIAQAILQEVGRYLGQALQQMVMAYDVEHIVLGGGVASAGASLLDYVLTDIKHQREASSLAKEMLQPEMFHMQPQNYEAGLWGAVVLAENGLHTMQPLTI
ncbi:MAG: ROK family protein [Anaerolineales bacterium]|nr:ROK family protein [Anaerolineales bacterium]